MKRVSGFSLIELMIAIAVMSFLLLAGMPNMLDWIRSIRIRTAAESVLNGIQLAKMESIRRNTQVSFALVSSLAANCSESDTSSSWVVSVGSLAAVNNKCASTDVNQLVQRRSSLEGDSDITLVSAAEASCIVFDGFGRVVAPAYCSNPITQLAFSYPSGGRTLQIRVTNGGAIRMCDPAAVAGDPRQC